jgi:hypothetical protein
MTETEKFGPTPREDLLNHISLVMKENDRFLHRSALNTYSAITDLANDSIYYLPDRADPERAEAYVQSALAHFVYHVLSPLGGALYIDLLSGNLPGCFRQLRTAHESLVKCFLADIRYTELDFFLKKLRGLEESAHTERQSITAMMKEFDEYLGLAGLAAALWTDLSQDWVHPMGLVNRILQQVYAKADIPTWALVTPMRYSMNEIDSLNELCISVTDFRRILAAALGKDNRN